MEEDSGLDVMSNDGILDIIPPSEYDPFEAKFCASLFWLVFHATEDGGLEDVPSQVTSPIQRLDKKNGFVVHREIAEFLCKGEVYCTVCTRIFPGKVMLAGHWSVIQTLSRNGVYVVDGKTDVAVTDVSLEQINPFNQGAHIALMDALMTAYSSQVVSIQSVVQAVRRFSTFSASRELPFDLEDAILLWVNKTNSAMNSKYTQPTRSSVTKLLRNREQVKKAGLRSEMSEDTPLVVFPVIDDVLKGMCDGRSLLGVLMFYEPNVVNIEDICCSSEISTEESIRNLDVFLGLCSQYFCTSVLALKVEDILYGSPSLKINIVALLAEMFSKCEGSVKTGEEKARSKTSWSVNGDVRVNGDNDGGVGNRSHSAPISRNPHNIEKASINNTLSESENISTSKNTRHQGRNIALKIQNYVENESLDVGSESREKHVSLEKISSSNMTSSNMTSSNMTSSNMTSSNMTSSNMTSSDDVTSLGGDDKDTVEVQGVVVKLRKKVARSIEPGGGHEALLSRRMKKSLCGWSQEDVSDTTSPTSDHEEQFDVKSNEPPCQTETRDPTQQPAFPMTDLDIPSPDEPHHGLSLDFNTLLEDDPPVDMLSPISETTEPGGSPGNSLNNSMSSSTDREQFRHHQELRHHEQLRHQEYKNPGDVSLTPPKAHTPRKSNKSHPRHDSIPRGSYIITDATHTPESALAAGIPIVERGSMSRKSDASSDAASLYRSSFPGVGLTNGGHGDEQSNDVRDSSNSLDQRILPSARDSSHFNDQRHLSGERAREQSINSEQRFESEEIALQSDFHEQPSRNIPREGLTLDIADERNPISNHWSERRSDNRFSTFTKSKKNCDESEAASDFKDTEHFLKEKAGDIAKENGLKTFTEKKEHENDSGPSLTWFGQAKDEVSPLGGGGEGGHKGEARPLGGGGEGAHRLAGSPGRKTNWGEMASEVNENSTGKDLNNASPKADPVSRELNLLRLRLAEKQRDIEAQKQRTKEQLEEERKRFGQNVFWLAVGKGRDKKEENEKNSHKKVLQEVSLNTESSNNNKFATFTKQSSLDEDLPPSMGKLQDRTFNLTNNSSVTNTKSIPEEKAQLPSQGPNKETIVRHSVEDRNPSDDIVQFRLSRQTPGNQDIHLNKELTPPMNFPGNLDNEFQNSQKPKTPVLNYKSRINVPVSFQAKTENYPTKSDSESSQKFSGNNGNFHDLDTNSKNTEQILRTPTSPLRKCWDTEAAVQSEPCIAVSESDYHVFEQNDANVVRNSGKQEEARVDNEMYTNLRVVENGSKDVVESGLRNHTRSGSDSSGRSEDDLKTGGVKLSPDEGEFEVNFDSSPVEEDRETPKKGLALFIGEENTVSNDGFTPEQLKKREKFLRNRQQKIEEDKLKKEALLEKKRRKEEKMREIQAHREREEQSRHAKLQEKREQAEHAKQERQKYEMRRKENPRTTYVDGTLGDHAGYTRTTVDIQGDVRIPGGNAGYLRSLGAHGGYTGTAVDTQGIDDPPEGHSGYARTHVKTPTSGENPFEVLGPAQTTTPSSFSGFTGVQSYVKPSGKTNRKLIINAISHVCLPGAVNKNTKEKCLQAMTESSAQHFLILFKEGLKFRALYSLDLESNQVLKVHGIGPRSVAEKMIEQLYKYNSGGKEFSKIPAKGFSLSVDGFTLQKSCWQSSKPSVQSKTASNYKHSRATR